MSYPLEGMLRPPVEMWSAMGAATGATILATSPDLFMMNELVAYASAAGLTGLAVMRMRQGYAVVRYHKRLKRLPYYAISQKELPVLGDNLFLGKGFKWTQKHAQRFRDTYNPDMRKYVDDSAFFKWARQHEIKHPDSVISKITSIDSPLNPIRPLPPIGGNRYLHAVGSDEEKDIFLPDADRPGNTLVLGQSRVGKTRLAELLVTADIMRNDGLVVVVDPKSDASLLTSMYGAAKRAGREDDFYCFHLGFPELSARYNAIANFARITEVATRIAGQLPGEGNSAAFKEFSWQFINIIARALVDIGERPDYNSILRNITDIEPLFVRYSEYWLPINADPTWMEDVNEFEKEASAQYKKNPKAAKFNHARTEALRRYVDNMNQSDPVMHGLMAAIKYDKDFFVKLVASLIPLLQKLTTGKIGELLSPEYFDLTDERPIFDIMQLVRRKGVLYVGLDSLQDMVVSSAVGVSLLSDIQSVGGSIYRNGYEHGLVDGEEGKLPKMYIHADELSEVVGGSDSFIAMINKLSGAGARFTGYTQTRSDLEVGMGDAAKARVIEGNFMNLICLRVREKYTAELLTDQLPEVELSTVMTVSGANDSSNVDNEVDFTSKTEDRISKVNAPLLEPTALMSLPKGQAFALMNGGDLYKLRIPLPSDKPDSIPETLRVMTEKMRSQYRTGEKWWAGAAG